MDLQNRNNFGSVRRLRDRFEQNINNNNSESVANRNYLEIDDSSIQTIENSKLSSKHQIRPIKPIIDKSFAERLSKTLKNEHINNKGIRVPNQKTGSNDSVTYETLEQCPHTTRSVTGQPECENKPNPVPKPPRTFAHDVYLELKFSKSKKSVSEKSIPLYSVPNKANKLKYRNRSQSDSQVMDNKKSNEANPNENIYDDCINRKTLDKTFKSYILRHFPCIRPDLK